jgi:acyl transferase domain-containing protein/3-hydroxymyristoyl/3-hydroxydecanoyl-(acyl carrier protein) dehydratase
VSAFAPIAVVGRSCILPGVASPGALFDAALTGRSLLSPTPRDRWSGLDPEVLARSAEAGARVACAVGGYVRKPDLRVARISERVSEFDRLDPLTHWLAHCAVEALDQAGSVNAERAGLIVGNLSYPSRLGAAFVESYWRGEASVDPRNRFSSGLPVHLVAEALAFGGPAFALDAACASSLYAIKLACDALNDGEASFMLAGGMNGADDLFIHLGFTALQALSPSGQSRPFHSMADGLVPSEGCALVALKRLEDAEKAGDRIFGVIRAVGLSNDGRQNGFLAPAASGQVRAMQAAFTQADMEPRDISFVECHATGTARGDATEIESLAKAYADTPLLLGALKGVLGHAITASGAASLINVLSAFEAGMAPPTPCETPTDGLRETAFVLPNEPAPWQGGVIRAAISNFGFGGNNAHLIVESHVPSAKKRTRKKSIPPPGDIAICSAGVIAGETRGLSAFRRALFGLPSPSRPAQSIELALEGLGFPPSDLKASLAQQTAVMEVVAEALDGVANLPADRTGVFVGMGCDATIARHGVRVRAGGDSAWLAANETAAPRLTAEGVLGTMPNIPANRIHAQRDFRGFGFTVASEELSGLAALAIAARALRAGELDAAVVGAVDLGCERANIAALSGVGVESPHGVGDAAVALVLKRRADAEAAGDDILVLLPVEDLKDVSFLADDGLAQRFGHTHAGSALLQVLADALMLQSRVRIDEGGAQPLLGVRKLKQGHASFSGRSMTSAIAVPETATKAVAVGVVPQFARFAASSLLELIVRLEANATGGEGDFRCALVGDDPDALGASRRRTIVALRSGAPPSLPGVAFADGAVLGELAFTFTGAAAAYAGAGRDLLLAWPEVGDALAARHAGATELSRALYGDAIRTLEPRVQLTGCALVCQAHAEFSKNVLKLAPQAAIGLSSGETNALLAFGVWRDLDAMLGEIEQSGLYGRALTGACGAAAESWGLPAGEKAAWTCWRLSAPRDAVEAALADEPRAYMTIVHAPDDCVIGGEPQACARIVEKVGRARAMPLGLDMVVHCEAMRPFETHWRRIHTRRVFPAEGVRFYSNAHNHAYTPTSESAAEAITLQALTPIDFSRTIRAAWDDGVRIFVEHGPRSILTGAVARILEGKPHLAVALDATERRGLRALSESVLKLWVHGVAVDVDAFEARLKMLRDESAPAAGSDMRKLILPVHPPDIRAPERETLVATQPGAASPPPRAADLQMMQPAPAGLSPLALFADAPAGQRQTVASENPMDRQAVARNLVTAVGETHRAFMARQADTHTAFLRMRTDLMSAAAARSSAAPNVQRKQPPRQPAPEKRPSETVAPLYSRAQLETLAGGKVSDVFGPLFQQQDGYARQVRMPQPPLLLADRVITLEGEAGSMGKGRIVTETDVDADAWYMHAGRMTPGAVIESGQADLLLASWLGADFLNRGDRVYRLLGCDLTFMGQLPSAGDTLRYDIHIDGHATTGDTRLFFFHYDCYIGDRLMISVRNGQAGFFSDDELAQSGGVLWSAEEDAPAPGARRDTPPRVTMRRTFDRALVDAFVDGRAFACFGAGFEMAGPHVRTPTLPKGRMRLLDEVVSFEPEGGPWGRGYLKARAVVQRDAWFYEGHFKNDPCMPGTLMADAATQALSFAMAAYGFTIDRDGWRFEPIAGELSRFVCRGQVTPEADHVLEYEVFIEEIIDGPEPAIFAALLCRSDGFKVFHCRRFGMRLVPDWPMTAVTSAPRMVGESTDVRGDLGALLACARGKPSDAFGALYAPFDGTRRAPRLPGDPYHFISRILSVDGAPGTPAPGNAVVAEYDAPVGAWYFEDGGSDSMPLSVLTEVLLQPCGWLASYMGFAANRAEDVAFRNLDGNDVLMHKAARPGTLRSTARLERFAEAGGSTIVFFHVTTTQGDDLVMTMKTAFGFFSPASLQSQSGLPTSSEAMRLLSAASTLPARDYSRSQQLSGAPRLARGRLKLLDTVDSFWPEGGVSGLGRLVARTAVDPEAWFFKAHFFQDPVQPGSLGLEALQQAMRAAVRLRMLGEQDSDQRFEPLALGMPFSWRFRGQVLPTSKSVITEVDIISIVHQGGSLTALSDGSVWVDGIRIYEVKRMGVRLRCPTGKALRALLSP